MYYFFTSVKYVTVHGLHLINIRLDNVTLEQRESGQVIYTVWQIVNQDQPNPQRFGCKSGDREERHTRLTVQLLALAFITPRNT